MASLASFSTLLCICHVQFVDPLVGDCWRFSEVFFWAYWPLQIAQTGWCRSWLLFLRQAVLFWLCSHPTLLFSSVAACTAGFRGCASDPWFDAIRSVSTCAYQRA